MSETENWGILEVESEPPTPTALNGRTEMARSAEATEAQATEAQVISVSIEMRKHSKYRLNEDSAISAAQILMAVVNRSGSRWELKLSDPNDSTKWLRRISQESNGPSDYSMFFRLTGPNSKNADIEWNDHVAALATKGASFKGEPWKVNRVNGAGWVPPTPEQRLQRKQQESSDMVSYADAELPGDIKPYFKEMYGVDAQIRILTSRIRTAIDSDFSQRFHAILMGPPGCGKSQMLACFKDALTAAGMNPNCVLSFDGTAITSQGITKALNKLDVMPRFIFVEEIEKSSNDAVAVFLGLMDDHGQLRKTTYREDIEKDCRVVVFATANNEEKLNTMQSGALASRFVAPIKFSRPKDDMLRMILIRDLNKSAEKMGVEKPIEVKAVSDLPAWQKANPRHSKWIETTIEWCHKIDNLDPRYVRSVCLNGRDELLTGEYQADLEATMDVVAHY